MSRSIQDFSTKSHNKQFRFSPGSLVILNFKLLQGFCTEWIAVDFAEFYTEETHAYKCRKNNTNNTDWWFGTFFIFPYIGNNHPNWLSYFSEGLVYHQPDHIFSKVPIFDAKIFFVGWFHDTILDDFSSVKSISISLLSQNFWWIKAVCQLSMVITGYFSVILHSMNGVF